MVGVDESQVPYIPDGGVGGIDVLNLLPPQGVVKAGTYFQSALKIASSFPQPTLDIFYVFVADAKAGDVYEVTFNASARDSNFYFGIDSGDNSEPLTKFLSTSDNRNFDATQVVTVGGMWASVFTTGLYRVKSDGPAVFTLTWAKNDLSGQTNMFNLNLTAKLVGNYQP